MGLKNHVLSIVWAMIIALLTLTSGGMEVDSEYENVDKVAHAFTFLILSFLLIVGFKKECNYLFHMDVRYSSVLLAIMYGVTIEFLQILVPGRQFELMDIVANSVGSVFGMLLFYIVYVI